MLISELPKPMLIRSGVIKNILNKLKIIQNGQLVGVQGPFRRKLDFGGHLGGHLELRKTLNGKKKVSGIL